MNSEFRGRRRTVSDARVIDNDTFWHRSRTIRIHPYTAIKIDTLYFNKAGMLKLLKQRNYRWRLPKNHSSPPDELEIIVSPKSVQPFPATDLPVSNRL